MLLQTGTGEHPLSSIEWHRSGKWKPQIVRFSLSNRQLASIFTLSDVILFDSRPNTEIEVQATCGRSQAPVLETHSAAHLS